MTTPNLCFITPTYRGDFDRFRLLRETITRFGQGHVPHYALVDTEDRQMVEEAKLPNVRVATTAELLPPEVEMRRVAYNASGSRTWKRWQRSLNRRFGWFPNSRYYGWQIQQLLKLAAPVHLPHDLFVSFDSDIIVCGEFGPQDFYQDGKAVLYADIVRLTQTNADQWYPNACRLFDVPPPSQPGDEYCDHVAQPFVFVRETVQAMHQWLKARHRKPWWQLLVDQPLGDWSEFMTYGVYVRKILKDPNVFLQNGRAASLWIEHVSDYRNAEHLIQKAFKDPAIKFLCLQADDHQRWRMEHFEPFIRRHLP